MKKFYPFCLLFLAVSLHAYTQEIQPLIGTSQQPVVISVGQEYDYNLQYQNLNFTPSPTGNSSEPGNTPGELSVTGSGGASYTIPIKVPDGINGVHPELSLTYNSQSGDGSAGYGWNVGPISSINRIGASMYHDNFIEAANYSLSRYMLDGERLILLEGDHEESGAVYTTENESNIKVKALGNFNINGERIGPDTFKVFYPDGSIAVYGLWSPDGNATRNHHSKNRETWAISYYISAVGNKITYHYRTAQRGLFIERIRYAYMGNNHISEVQFVYDDKHKKDFYYISGERFENHLILKEINVKNNGEGYSNYLLEHDLSRGGYERLVRVTQLSGNEEKSLNPTEFTYFDNNESNFMSHQFGESGLSDVNKYNSAMLSGDFNGDGFQDNIIYNYQDKNSYTPLFSFFESNNQTGNTVNANFRDIFTVNALDQNDKLLKNDVLCLVAGGNTLMHFRIHGISGSSTNFSQIYSKSHSFRRVTAQIYNPNDCYYDDDLPDLTPLKKPTGSGKDKNTSTTTQKSKPPTWTPPPTSPGEPDDPEDPRDPRWENTEEREIPKRFVSGDFNGDGLMDVLVIEQQYTITHVTCENDEPVYTLESVTPYAYLVELDRRKTTNFVNEAGSIPNIHASTPIYTGDFTGDGKTDILVMTLQGTKLYNYSNITNSLVEIGQLSHYRLGHARTKKYPILLGDFNGDGATDICFPDDRGSSKWHFVFSRRDGSFQSMVKEDLIRFDHIEDAPYTNLSDWHDVNYLSIDLDSDGKSDIVKISFSKPLQSGYTPITTWFNLLYNKIEYNNLEFELKTTEITTEQGFFSLSSGIDENTPSAPLINFSNKNNSRRFNDIYIIQDNAVAKFKNTLDHQEEMFLRQITRGNGVKETIYYTPLSDKMINGTYPAYISNFEEIFPNVSMNVNMQMKVVRQLRINAYGGYEKYQDYRYREAVINTEGIGFLGFKALHQSNWYNANLPKFTTITEFDTELRGAVKRSITVPNDIYSTNGINNLQSIESSLLSYSLFDYDVATSTNGVFSLQLKKSIEADKLNDVLSFTENIEFDEFRNIKESKTRIYPYSTSFSITSPPNNHLQQTVSKLTFENSNTLNSSNKYYIGMPKSKETKVTVQGGSSSGMTDYNEFDYNDQLLVKEFTYWRDSSDKVTELNDYDAYGNLIVKSLVTEQDGTRIKFFDYDDTYRFIKEITEVDGISSYYNYDSTTELLTSEGDIFGNTVSYQYDDWGNVEKEYHPFGVVITNNYQLLSQQRLKHSLSSNEGKESYTIYDALGRELEVGEKNFQGLFSKRRTVYDDNDQPILVSEPYFHSPTSWAEMEYDDYGRTKEASLASGKTITFAYNGLQITEDDGTQTKVTIKNQLDQIISLTDEGGTITYKYQEDGNLIESDFQGFKITMQYDDWGRKKKLTDPSAGIYEYKYNQFGEVIQEKTPNGTTYYEYNTFGMLEQEQIIGSNTDLTKFYQYDESTRQVESILLLDDYNNLVNNYNYSYDENGRLDNIDETLHDGVSFSKEIEFGDFGQIEHVYYSSQLDGISSSLQVDYLYTNGVLTEIFSPEKLTPLWMLQNVDARGNITRFNYGNGIRANYQYDDYGFPLKITHGVNTFGVIDFDYDFNTSKGILEHRTSSNNHWGVWKESFNHDNQNQLTKSSPEINGNDVDLDALVLENSYDNRARITKNEQVGDYNYNSDSQYQLDNIDLNQEAFQKYFDKHKQEITYNTFKSPHQIIEYFDFNDEDNKEVINFTYNAFNQRSARYYGGNQPDKYNRSKRKYYSGIAPIEISQDVRTGKSKVVYFIGGDAYQAPVAYEEKFIGNSSEGGRFLYLHRDYLGTIFAITKDAPSGNMPTSEQDVLVERRHFDAWGGLVLLQKEGETEATFYDEVKFNDELYLDRGYTGHEHLASVSLIHMNGRLYDAKLRRFLAPDNFIQDPYNTQNFNRYAYVYNNPLIYNDPSGEIIVSAIIVVAAYGILSGVNGSFNPANWNTASQVIFTVVVAVATSGAVFGWTAVKGAIVNAGVAIGKATVATGKGIVSGAKWTGKMVKASIKNGNFWGNMLGGTVNAAYNWDSSNPLKSLAYFAAGFLGTALGAGSEKVWVGMVAGGSLTVGAAWALDDMDEENSWYQDIYESFQKFVGGALSSLAGMQSFNTMLDKGDQLYNFKNKANYLFGKKNKFVSKTLTYGIQSTATDFAYSDRKYFTRRSWNTHLNTFIFGAANGAMQYESKQLFSERWIGYGMDYFAQSINQGYNPFDYSKGWRKTGIFSLKAYGFTY